ncbi:MAG: DUF2063 domain-containing protein [Gammaproteobacteria bacterium]|nr:DUF2063 domain-containing protein [Gammaproteobacteria bacterium]
MTSPKQHSQGQHRLVQSKVVPKLKDLQNIFKQYLMHGDSAIATHIVSTKTFANDARLAIYSNAYYARLAESLEKDYTSISVLLGDNAFYQLCERYTDTFPSKNPSLRWFGQHMVDFLSRTSPYNESPYLAELAVLEWAFITAFDAPNAVVATELDAAQIPAGKWPELTIKLHPSIRWFKYQWNILPLWRATNEINHDAAKIAVPKLLDTTEQCVVWRKGLSTQYRTLDQDEAKLLLCIAEGGNFSQMCEALVGLVDDPNQLPMRAASILKSWLSNEMISHLAMTEE